jgi:hypothetical protein
MLNDGGVADRRSELVDPLQDLEYVEADILEAHLVPPASAVDELDAS